jgi:hypothetical protein
MIPASDCAKMQVVENWEGGQNRVLHQNARNCTKTDTKLAPRISGDQRRKAFSSKE